MKIEPKVEGLSALGILRTVSDEKIQAALAVPEFRQRLNALDRRSRESYSADAWFQKQHPNASLTSVAHFSMEFMLSEALPIYSGGFAGDWSHIPRQSPIHCHVALQLCDRRPRSVTFL